MSLQSEITTQLKEAMKLKDRVALESLRSIKSALLLLQTENSAKEITVDDELRLLQKLAKQRKDSAKLYQDQKRDDLAGVELAQLEVIERFLPEQLSEEEIKQVVYKLIDSLDANSPKDMGRVIGAANKELTGRADGKLIADIVREKLSKKAP